MVDCDIDLRKFEKLCDKVLFDKEVSESKQLSHVSKQQSEAKISLRSNRRSSAAV